MDMDNLITSERLENVYGKIKLLLKIGKQAK